MKYVDHIGNLSLYSMFNVLFLVYTSAHLEMLNNPQKMYIYPYVARMLYVPFFISMCNSFKINFK